MLNAKSMKTLLTFSKRYNVFISFKNNKLANRKDPHTFLNPPGRVRRREIESFSILSSLIGMEGLQSSVHFNRIELKRDNLKLNFDNWNN